MMKTTAMVVMQDIVRKILIKMTLLMLIIITGMIAMTMMMIMMMIIIIIAIKPGEVSKNKMQTNCMTRPLSSLCGHNQMTSGSTAAICLSNSTLPPPTPQPPGVPTKSIDGRSSRKEAAIHQGSI
jgi:hypothetical protein